MKMKGIAYPKIKILSTFTCCSKTIWFSFGRKTEKEMLRRLLVNDSLSYQPETSILGIHPTPTKIPNTLYYCQ